MTDTFSVTLNKDQEAFLNILVPKPHASLNPSVPLRLIRQLNELASIPQSQLKRTTNIQASGTAYNKTFFDYTFTDSPLVKALNNLLSANKEPAYYLPAAISQTIEFYTNSRKYIDDCFSGDMFKGVKLIPNTLLDLSKTDNTRDAHDLAAGYLDAPSEMAHFENLSPKPFNAQKEASKLSPVFYNENHPDRIEFLLLVIHLAKRQNITPTKMFSLLMAEATNNLDTFFDAKTHSFNALALKQETQDYLNLIVEAAQLYTDTKLWHGRSVSFSEFARKNVGLLTQFNDCDDANVASLHHAIQPVWPVSLETNSVKVMARAAIKEFKGVNQGTIEQQNSVYHLRMLSTTQHLSKDQLTEILPNALQELASLPKQLQTMNRVIPISRDNALFSLPQIYKMQRERDDLETFLPNNVRAVLDTFTPDMSSTQMAQAYLDGLGRG